MSIITAYLRQDKQNGIKHTELLFQGILKYEEKAN